MAIDAVLLEHRAARVDRAEWRCALQPLLPVTTPKEDYPRYKRKIRKFFDAFAGLPLSSPFLLENPVDVEEFRLVIVGSDEVWNLKHPWYGGYSLFYGVGLRSKRIASYAATFGNFASSEGLKGYWSEKLNHFSNISVRDLNSKRLIQDALGFSPELVLDPCLQFPQVVAPSAPQEEAPVYVAVYGHSFPGWFQHMARQWACRRQYTLISIGYRNDWADRQWIDAGPEDFAGFIAGAKAVMTNFFHGCVFALVNGKPFACALSDYRSNKVGDLAMMVGATRHVMRETITEPQYDAVLSEPLDPSISRRIAELRRNSGDYLRHVLQ